MMRVLLMPRLLLNDDVIVEHFCPLDPGPPYRPPNKWDAQNVQHRFAEALDTLRKLPIGRLYPRGIYNPWPAYALDWNTFMARMSADVESMAVEGKLNQDFVSAYQDWSADRNRWRERPSAKEIGNMERALLWPGRYLSGQHEMARAFNICSLAQACGVSVRDIVRGGKHHGVRSGSAWRQLALEAANRIALGLRLDEIVVF
jgi:hypothetical protein